MHEQTVVFAASVGDEVTDKNSGITGEVTHITRGRYDQGVWIQGTDANGMPFQHYIDERDLA